MFDVIRVPIKDITISDRARQDVGDLTGLMFSIEKYGVLNAILLNEDYQLIAGERRLRACQELALPDVPARILPGLSPDDQFMIEFIENYDRKDFT
jgi:ParB family chromosome partitioning protein